MTTSFSDSLTTIDPNNITGLGANWIQGAVPGSDTSQTNGVAARIAVATKDGINALTWEGFGAVGPFELLRGYAVPLPCYVDLRGRNQFVQCTNVKLSTGADGSELSSGLLTQFNAALERMNTYVLILTPTSRNWFVFRIDNSIPTLLSSGVAGADGDIWKMTADTSISTQVTLNVFRNGGLLSNVVDTSIFRKNYGSPGLYCQFDTNGSVTATAEWRTFSAGIF